MEQRSDWCGGVGSGRGGWLEVLVDVLESTLGWGGRRMVGHCGGRLQRELVAMEMQLHRIRNVVKSGAVVGDPVLLPWHGT